MGGTPGSLFFYVVLLLLIVSFRKKKTEGTETEELGKGCTQELKGFAILLVLLGHQAHLFGLITMPVTDYLGAQGVELFLFLSGFGLTASYFNKGLKGYWRKRLLTIYVPYTMVNILKVAAMFFIYGFSLNQMLGKDIFFNFIGLSVSLDTSMWYIQYILVCYLLFYLVFHFTKLSGAGKSALLFFLFALMGIALGVWQTGPGAGVYLPFMECYSHYLSFPVGVLCFLSYDKIKKLSTRNCFIAAFIFLAGFLLCSARIPEYVFYLSANLFCLLFAVTLFIGLTRLGLHSALLEKLGGLAFHIYLNEYIVMMLLSLLFYNNGNPGLPMAVRAAVIILCSVLIAAGTQKISGWCLKRKGDC